MKKTQRRRPQGRVDEQLDDDEVPKLWHLRSFVHVRCKRLPGSGPAEAAEEEGFGPEIQQRDGVRKVEEPLVNLCQPKQGAKALGEERRGGEEMEE